MITEQTEKDINDVILDRNTGEELLGTNVSMKVLINCAFDKVSLILSEVVRTNSSSLLKDYLDDTIQLLCLIEEQREKGFNLLDPILKELGI